MKKTFFLIVSGLLLLSACAKDIEEKAETGSIVGSVYDKNVGDPISIVQLQLSPGGKSTVTGTDGTFSFVGIEAGSYTVTATKKGYNDAKYSVTVTAGKQSECDMVMERIPAYVTADKTELDFGDNVTLTTLSFNIVNGSYEDLAWHIDYDKSSFIKEVAPAEGITQFGKTSAIVVTIDREKLTKGVNESTLVVISDNGDGSSEVKVKATGQEKVLASLNVIEATDITVSSAIVQGEIISGGIPPYTERGFVYAKSQNPTLETTIQKVTVPVNEDKTYKASLTNLEYGSRYYVRAYAINAVGTAYSTNQIDFSPVAIPPVVTIRPVTGLNLTDLKVTFHASVDNAGNPPYTEKGFVYSTVTSTPTLADGFIPVSGSTTGSFSADLTGLTLEKTYYVRGYATNASGTVYSDATSFKTNEALPVIVTEDPTNIDMDNLTAVLHATISDAGTPSYTERGFVYSTEYEEPTINDEKIAVTGTGTGAFEYRMTNFPTDKITYVRAYAINHKGIVYGKAKMLFMPDFLDKGDYIVVRPLGIAVQKKDVGKGKYKSLNTLCVGSSIGGFADWRMPTIDELASLYELKDKIGNFEPEEYWSSDYYYDKGGALRQYTISFSTGEVYGYWDDTEHLARAVRTLK